MDYLTQWFYSCPSDLSSFTELQEIKFFIHDQEHTVKLNEITSETTLNDYLRNEAHLMGTKNMCFEGGCGVCVVAVTTTDPLTQRETTIAVNSCLVLIYACSGWKIHTSEAIGDPKMGYHPVQKALVQFNGTQCGFCSSGMIMNMYAMYEKGNFTMKDVDDSFSGNICRCTGYRSILAAFKSLATDANSDTLGSYIDIEDIKVCSKKEGKCQSLCMTPCNNSKPYFYNFKNSKWIKVYFIKEIIDIMKQYYNSSYMLVGGNTARGVYKNNKNPDIYIDINSVTHLIEYKVDNKKLVLGANMRLTKVIALFQKLAKEYGNFKHLSKLANHISLIANVPVRNIGTLAGNLFIKHQHPEFPSDIYLIFEAADATVQIVDTQESEISLKLRDFLKYDMKYKIIKTVTLPGLDDTYKYESYKIMPRAQNAHALVNAGFLLKLNSDNKIEYASIVYGCINPSFTHATNAEKFLEGKYLFKNETLQGLFRELDEELKPDYILPDSQPEFRKKLAISLCYKFILSIAPDGVISPRNKSGGRKQNRPVSKGTQEYGTNKSLYPLTEPIPKLEALAQCSGQAKYIFDKPHQPGQLYVAFVLANAPPNSVIININKKPALELNGVVAYLDKNDVPGKNTFTPTEATFVVEEELFCSGIVKYYFQPIGIIIANSQKIAEEAAKLVEVNFKVSDKKPLLNVRDVLEQGVKENIKLDYQIEPKKKGTDIKHVIKGEFDIFSQYHFYMETQCCIVIPTEDGLDVFPTSQSMDFTQNAIAALLNIPNNKINIVIRRVGGAYGGKVSRNCIVSCCAALAAHKLNKPIKFWVPLIDNMNVFGMRYGCTANYEIGVNQNGVIQYLNSDIYSDYGCEGGNEPVGQTIAKTFMNTYESSTWNVKTYRVKTDKPTGTWCRAPGTLEGVTLAEIVMQHIASELKIDPTETRLINLNKENPYMLKFINEMKEWAKIDKRKKEVEEFNKANRWIKKGLYMVPMCFPNSYFGNWGVLVSIFQGDGSVAVMHGGIEMGQGINTKVAQVCAYSFGIPLDYISIKPSNNIVTPNTAPSFGSITSESVCYATIQTCNILKQRMAPIRETMTNPTWKDLIKKCYLENVDLSASFMFNPKIPDIKDYSIYGVTCAEVEVDILTGLHQVNRLDLLEDTGNSMSPQIDIGQVEGAIIMGIGYWTTEELVFDPQGKLLTNRTWNYKPPGAKDIPIDFKVKFPVNNPNPGGVLKSKATAEPPLNMTCVVPLAIRDAVNSARLEIESTTEKWNRFNGPTTVEQTFLQSLHNYKLYTL